MMIEDMKGYLPTNWHEMDLVDKKFELFEIHKGTNEYRFLESKIIGDFNLGVRFIYRIQNPYLYTKFYLKSLEYNERGFCNIIPMFHDSCPSNVVSIVTYNFDWRYGERFKYGPGVYFSPSAELANAYSSKRNGHFRAMFLTDVLVGRVQVAKGPEFLPDPGYDTVRSSHGATYVKYFDNEYYPHYVFYYTSK